MGEEITLCPSCNCMTHTATLNKCGKCGATKPTAPADEGEKQNCLEGTCPFENFFGDKEKIATLQAALNDAHTDSRQQKDRVERLVTENKKLQAALAEKEAQVKELRNEWGNEFECREAAEKRYQTEWNACANFRNELAEKDKRIEELEEQRSVSLKQINTLGTKLKSAEAVVEAARYVIKNTGQEWSHQTRDGFRQAKRALEDYDNQQKQEPGEQHFIEEGLSERCKKV